MKTNLPIPRAATLGLTIAVLGAAVSAQTSLYSRPAPAGPDCLATEPTSGTVLALQAGSTGMTTTRWNGSAHVTVATVGPPNRLGGAMVAAPNNEVILFGGDPNNGTYLNDTWRWNGSQWQAATPPNSPSPRQSCGVAQTTAGTVVLFGGGSFAGAYLGDTWEWDGTTWTRTSTTGPSGRVGAAMASDGAGGVVLFGGVNAGGILGDIWTYSAGTWTPLATQGTPPVARARAILALDPARDLGAGPRNDLVLVAGIGNAGCLVDVWILRNGTWLPTAVTVPNSCNLNGAYDTIRREIVLADLFGSGNVVGGFGFTTFGSGCACGAGPAPTLTGTGQARVGQTVSLDVQGQPNSAMFVALDLLAVPSGTPIPNMPGCLQFIGGPITSVFTLLDATGAGSYQPTIPADPGLIGFDFYYQAVDLGFGCVTNALEMRIGRS